MLRRSILATALLLVPGAAWAQSEAALRDRVAQLVDRLEAPKADARDAAEASLIKLGPRVLPFLPDDAKAPKGARERLARVRDALSAGAEQAGTQASTVTLRGKGLRLSEVIKELQSQTGNRITDRREEMGGEATNPGLDLDLEKVPFFKALDEVAAKAGFTLNFFTGDGTIGMGLGAGAPGLPNRVGEDPVKPQVTYSGPFRIAFKQVIAARDLQTGERSANAQFEIAWEPRLRPMLLALKADAVAIVDDQGGAVLPTVTDESRSVVLRQENPVAELNLNMDAPDRAAQALRSLKIQADVTTPAGLRTFRFPSLTGKPSAQKQGDVSVAFEGFEPEESNWKIGVRLEMPGEGPAFESYRQGLFNNRVWLQRADGSRFEHNGGFNNVGSDGGRLSFQYIFVDAPGKPADYQLVYETPSRVLTIPLEFEFKDIPLP